MSAAGVPSGCIAAATAGPGVPAARGKLPISVIVLTYNEERHIGACLASVADWAAEVFVVDSGSTDRTLEIAAAFTDRIVQHPFENYARQRNWAQENLPLRHEWVLHIDADERVTPELARSMRAFLAGARQARVNGAMFSRRTVFLGRWIRHGGHYPVFHARLFRPAKGRCEDRLYDQHFLVEAPLVRLDGDLIDIVTTELDPWSAKHLRWATEEAHELLGSGAGQTRQVAARAAGTPIERRRWLRNGVFGRSPLFLRAFAYFGYRYVLRLGFLDGVQGLIFHFLHGCWYRFYIDARIWELRRGQPAPRPANAAAPARGPLALERIEDVHSRD